MLLILARMVSCSAMAATQTITSSEPAADSAPGGLAQYTASVTRLMQISVDLGLRIFAKETVRFLRTVPQF